MEREGARTRFEWREREREDVRERGGEKTTWIVRLPDADRTSSPNELNPLPTTSSMCLSASFALLLYLLSGSLSMCVAVSVSCVCLSSNQDLDSRQNVD